MIVALALVLAELAAPPLPANIEDVTQPVRAVISQRHDALLASRAMDASAYADALVAYAEVLMAHGLFDDATVPLQQALEMSGDRDDWRYLLAFTLNRRSMQAEALVEYDRLRDAHPNDALILLRRGCLLVDMGRLDEAQVDLEHAMQVSGPEPFGLACQGRIAYLRGEYAAAIGNLEQVVTLAPGVTSVQHMLGLAYQRTGDMQQARAHMALHGDVQPSVRDPAMLHVQSLNRSVQALVERGLGLLAAGRVVAAENELALALTVSPDDVPAQMAMVTVYLSSERVDDALALLTQIVDSDPDYAPAKYRLGQVTASLGELERARDWYVGAVELQPENLEAAYQLAAVELLIGDLGGAARELERLSALVPDNIFIQLQLVAVLLADTRCERALSMTAAAVERVPNRGDLIHMHIRSVAVCGTTQQRRDLLATADLLVAARPEPLMYEARGLLRLAAGDRESGIADLRHALRENTARNFGDVLRARLAALDGAAADPGPIPEKHPLRVLPGSFGGA